MSANYRRSFGPALRKFVSGAAVASLVVGSGCSREAPTASLEQNMGRRATEASGVDQVAVCHTPTESPAIITVPMSDLAAHLAHGDYIAGYSVDKLNAVGDGVHFRRITDALAAARSNRIQFEELQAGACRVTISVGPGQFMGNLTSTGSRSMEQFPLVFDVPDITLQGRLQLEQVNGRAKPTSVAGTDSTVLVPDHPMTTTPTPQSMVLIKDFNRKYYGNGTVIDGFSFQSGQSVSATNSGFGIFSMRVARVVISNNRFATSLSTAADLRSRSAVIDRNYAEGLGTACGFCLGGSGTYKATGNTIVNGIRVGILFVPVSNAAVPAGVTIDAPQASEAVYAALTNNEITGHTRNTNGFATAVRIGVTGVNGAVQTTGIDLVGNTFTGNTFGLMVDAGLGTGPGVVGNVTVSLSGNTIAQNCRRDMMVAFRTPPQSLVNNPMATPPLNNSSITINGVDRVLFSRTYYDNPVGSPAYGNTLMIGGSPLTGTSLFPPVCP